MQALRADRRRLHLCRDCGQPVAKRGARWAVRCDRCQATAAARKRRRRALIAVLSGRPVPARLIISTLPPAPAPTAATVARAPKAPKVPKAPKLSDLLSDLGDALDHRGRQRHAASLVDELSAKHGAKKMRDAMKRMRLDMQQRGR